MRLNTFKKIIFLITWIPPKPCSHRSYAPGFLGQPPRLFYPRQLQSRTISALNSLSFAKGWYSYPMQIYVYAHVYIHTYITLHYITLHYITYITYQTSRAMLCRIGFRFKCGVRVLGDVYRVQGCKRSGAEVPRPPHPSPRTPHPPPRPAPPAPPHPRTPPHPPAPAHPHPPPRTPPTPHPIYNI